MLPLLNPTDSCPSNTAQDAVDVTNNSNLYIAPIDPPVDTEVMRKDYYRLNLNPSYTVGYQEARTILLRPPIDIPIHEQQLPFPSLSPAPFHVSISASPITGRPGSMRVHAHPRSPEGNHCLLECGQLVVFEPNFVVAWYLDSCQIVNNELTYSVHNNLTWTTRTIHVSLLWGLVQLCLQNDAIIN